MRNLANRRIMIVIQLPTNIINKLINVPGHTTQGRLIPN